jgi:hypothetical protein
VQAVQGATGRFGDGVVGEDRRKPEKGSRRAPAAGIRTVLVAAVKARSREPVLDVPKRGDMSARRPTDGAER